MSTPAVATKSSIQYYRSPKTAVRTFVIRQTFRPAVIFGLIGGLYMLSKASSYLKAYPTEASRQKIAESLGQNTGIEALLGQAHHIETVSGYVTWNFLCLMTVAGAIWALLKATKTFRGEEDAGRWELFLAGQTTARRAAAHALLGLASGVAVVYVLLASAVMIIGKLHGADFTVSAGMFFALALTIGAAEFFAVGALASQLMPVRSRAVGLAAITLGIFYILRMIADTTSARWLLDVSPLGWIERLQPMYGSQPVWLLPIAGFILILILLTIFLAGRRDLGEGILADKDSAKARFLLLRSPLGAAFRFSRVSTFGWLAAIALGAYVYGQLANSAVVQVLSQSQAAKRFVHHLSQNSQTVAITAFMGIIFLIIMILTMFYVASAVNHVRADEAAGYADNFLVRPVSRGRWLWGRVMLIAVVLVLAGFIGATAAWAGEASQHGGITFHTLLLAGINAIIPACFVAGAGICAFGLLPRLTGAVMYAVIGWSFLLLMLSSGVPINHWLLDTSVLHHVALAPAANPNWTADAVLTALGLGLAIVGALSFNVRDTQGE